MTLSPIPGSYCQIWTASGTTTDLVDEPMSEVDLTSLGYPRYTVYEITSAAKRYLSDAEVPVFQYLVGGSGDWITLTPARIEYCGGRIFLSTPLGANDTVRAHSGKYMSPTKLAGAATLSFTDRTAGMDVTCYGDPAKIQTPGLDSWEASLDVFFAKLCAELKTTGGNANSHIIFRHVRGGVEGNDITVAMVDPGSNNSPLSVSVTGTDVTVSLATGSNGNIISKAREVAAAINASIACRQIGIMAYTAPGETGEGVVSALSQTALSGGADEVDFNALKKKQMVFVFYDNYSIDSRHEGYGYIDEISWTGKPGEPLKAGLKVSGTNSRLQWRFS
jgi:hypothetical protein